ncbi:ORF2 [Wuhan Fly Virus 2]|uniref:ORF2 n=1 Tax=Wuhan Fly Virus 2 TaxID=1608102 RepID=A0A0B5KTJ1_9RHAB|nr:ORF2 [Wuhan Fly Virus 2]AJG39157.1 ORF2 [Wuhan Fly Virus 2]
MKKMETPRGKIRGRVNKTRVNNKDVCDMLNNRGGNLIKTVENTLMRDNDMMDESEAPSTSGMNPNSVSDPNDIPLDVLETGKELLEVVDQEEDSEMECEEILSVSEVGGKVYFSVPPSKVWTSEQVVMFAAQFMEIIKGMKSEKMDCVPTPSAKKDSPESKKPKITTPVPSTKCDILKRLSEGVVLKPIKIGLKPIRVTLDNLGVSYQEAEEILKRLEDASIISLIRSIKISKGQNGRFLSNYKE